MSEALIGLATGVAFIFVFQSFEWALAIMCRPKVTRVRQIEKNSNSPMVRV